MSRPIFPDFEQELVRCAAAQGGGSKSMPVTHENRPGLFGAPRIGQAGRAVGRGLIPAITVAVSVAVLIVAVLALRTEHRRATSAAAQPAVSVPAGVERLIGPYAIFRRAQTSADIATAGALTPGGGTLTISNLAIRGAHHQTYLVAPLAHYTVVRNLTRGVERDGARIGLFVEQLTQPLSALRVTTRSGGPVSASTRAAVLMVLRADFLFAGEAGGRQAPFLLAVRAAAPSGAVVVEPLRTSSSRRVALLERLLFASLHGDDETIVAVEPDGVRTIRWAWQQTDDKQTHQILPPVSVTAPVIDNVAVAHAPARFNVYGIGPSSVTFRYPKAHQTVRNVTGAAPRPLASTNVVTLRPAG